MNLAGWIFMLVSWGAIIALCVFCFKKIFDLERQRPEEKDDGDSEPSHLFES